MQLIATVKFNRTEREVLRRAMTHIRIAFPDFDERDSKQGNRRVSLARVLPGIVNGEAATREQIEVAVACMGQLARICEAQVERSYWESLQPNEPVIVGSVDFAGHSAPGTDMIWVMCEARAGQAVHAREAVAVLIMPIYDEDPESTEGT